jgi:DNA-binding NtrC family response regulator
MTGVELFKQMRRLRQGIEGLLITAYASVMKPNEATDAGLQQVVEKPVDVPKLVSLIEQAFT